jgi:hypothetical protein
MAERWGFATFHADTPTAGQTTEHDGRVLPLVIHVPNA